MIRIQNITTVQIEDQDTNITTVLTDDQDTTPNNTTNRGSECKTL
jgi:hypothetical protein